MFTKDSKTVLFTLTIAASTAAFDARMKDNKTLNTENPGINVNTVLLHMLGDFLISSTMFPAIPVTVSRVSVLKVLTKLRTLPTSDENFEVSSIGAWASKKAAS
mmetsp:Transcript_149726/g.276187  ORF Transcript_149726/g.276187 Transcript_149726/m.276187 type:complete len:104 (+) Transcript_149726:1063-1374(+)